MVEYLAQSRHRSHQSFRNMTVRQIVVPEYLRYLRLPKSQLGHLLTGARNVCSLADSAFVG
jgi:hypothetical protein